MRRLHGGGALEVGDRSRQTQRLRVATGGHAEPLDSRTKQRLAVRVQTVISLAEMSERLNVMCLFNEKTREVTTGDGKKVKPLTYGSVELS